MLTAITGPMFSGKSSALISRCLANAVAQRHVMVFKPNNDARYDSSMTKIVSHNMDTFPAIAIDKESPWDCWNTILVADKPDVVAFDETQFFEPKTMVSLVDTLMKDGFDIIIAGLVQDFKGRPFGAMPEILARADEIVSLKAVCSKCKGIGIATRTHRKSEDNEQVVVGGIDKYEARCYTCWSTDNEI